MIQGVIFDMDGLMFDTEQVWGTLWKPACEAVGQPAPDRAFIEGCRGLAGQNLINQIERYYPGHGGQILQAILRLGDEAFAAGVPLKPGLIELLDWLKARGIPRIVASSSPRAMIERNLRNTGTDRYFDEVVCGAEVKYSKPHPETFLQAAARLGLPPERCLVLEDSYNGVRAGHAAGCVTVMVPDLLQPTAEIRALYSACCRDLFEVKAMLERGAL